MTSIKTNSLNMTVATTADDAVSVRRDIQLLKAALLYADSVTLCSPTASWYLSRLRFTELTDEKQRLEFALQKSDLTAQERKLAIQLFELYSQLRIKPDRTPAETALMHEMGREFSTVWQFIQDDVTSDAHEAGVDELQPALDSGFVTIHLLDMDGVGEFADEFLRVIGNAVLSGETYPLFDAGTGFLIQSAIHDGLITPSTVNVTHSRSSMLSADILQRLPQFESASFEDILHTRKELAEPLIRFRAAVLSYASEMQSAPWDKDFRVEAEHLVIERIRPAVLEIEQAAQESSFVRALRHKGLTDQGLWKPAALGIAASSLDYFAHFAHAALMAGAVMTLAELREFVRIWHEVRQEHAAAESEIKRSQLYFVYKAARLMQE